MFNNFEKPKKEDKIENKIVRDHKSFKEHPRSTLIGMMNGIDSARFYKMDEDLEGLKPFLRDFTNRIKEEKPDYLVFLDKGVRPFVAPFSRYLNSMGEEKPNIVLFNDDSFKRSKIDKETLDGKLFAEYKKMVKGESGKKIFIVDEMFYKGSTADLFSQFFKRHAINGTYFAFSYGDKINFDIYQEKIAHDPEIKNKIVINDFDAEPILFSKGAAYTYVADSVGNDDDIVKTERRFSVREEEKEEEQKTIDPWSEIPEYGDKESEEENQIGERQQELKEMKIFSDEIRRQTYTAILSTLESL